MLTVSKRATNRSSSHRTFGMFPFFKVRRVKFLPKSRETYRPKDCVVVMKEVGAGWTLVLSLAREGEALQKTEGKNGWRGINVIAVLKMSVLRIYPMYSLCSTYQVYLKNTWWWTFQYKEGIFQKNHSYQGNKLLSLKLETSNTNKARRTWLEVC